jgi:hypothetical protein
VQLREHLHVAFDHARRERAELRPSSVLVMSFNAMASVSSPPSLATAMFQKTMPSVVARSVFFEVAVGRFDERLREPHDPRREALPGPAALEVIRARAILARRAQGDARYQCPLTRSSAMNANPFL